MVDQGKIGNKQPDIPSVSQIATSLNTALEGKDPKGRIYMTPNGFERMNLIEAGIKWFTTGFKVHLVSATNIENIAIKFQDKGSQDFDLEKVKKLKSELASRKNKIFLTKKANDMFTKIWSSITEESVAYARIRKKPLPQKPISLDQKSVKEIAGNTHETNSIKSIFDGILEKFSETSKLLEGQIDKLKQGSKRLLKDVKVTIGFNKDKDQLRMEKQRRKSISEGIEMIEVTKFRSPRVKFDAETVLQDITYAIDNGHKLRLNEQKEIISKPRRPTKFRLEKVQEQIGRGSPGRKDKSQESAAKLVEIIKAEMDNPNMEFSQYTTLDKLMEKMKKWDWFLGVRDHNAKVKESFEDLQAKLKEIEGTDAIKEKIDETKFITLEAMLLKAMSPEEKNAFRKTFVLTSLNYFSLKDILTEIQKKSGLSIEKQTPLMQLLEESNPKEKVFSIEEQKPWMQLAYDLLENAPPNQAKEVLNQVNLLPTTFFDKIPFNTLIEKLTPKEQAENVMVKVKDSFSSKIPALLKTKGKGKEYSTLVKTFAQDLTGLTLAVYENIKPGEFAKLAWSGDKKNEDAPNITKMIALSTNSTNYALDTIMKQIEKTEIAKIMNFFIDVADELLKKRNYLQAEAVLAAFANSAVNRLYMDPKKLESNNSILTTQQKKKLALLKKQVSPNGNYKTPRELAKDNITKNLSFIPQLGIALTELTMIDTKMSTDQLKIKGKETERYDMGKLKLMAEPIKIIMAGKSDENDKSTTFNLLEDFEKMTQNQTFQAEEVFSQETFNEIIYQKSRALEPRKTTTT